MPFIMLTVLIDMMSIGLIIPVLPALVGTFTGSQTDQAFWFGAATFFGVGFILGPVMGGLLGDINLQLPFFVAGCLVLVNLIYGYSVLPESLPVERRHAFAWKSANPLTALVLAFVHFRGQRGVRQSSQGAVPIL